MNPLDQLAAEVPHLQHSFDPVFVFGSGSFGMTQYVLWMIICFVITLIVVLTAGKRLTLIPTNKFTNMVEYGYEFVKKDMGESSITWALAAISFVYFIFDGIKVKGLGGYLKSFAPSGLPVVMVPIVWFLELFSTVLRVLTLAVRLYGNMFAGHMVLGIFALLTSVFIGSAIQGAGVAVGSISIAWMLFLFAMYALEVLVAFLQAYVFTILSAVYIGLATSDH